MLSERQQALTEMITTWKSGKYAGRPTNDWLKELKALLCKYSYNDQELDMLEAEIFGATSPRAIKRLNRGLGEVK